MTQNNGIRQRRQYNQDLHEEVINKIVVQRDDNDASPIDEDDQDEMIEKIQQQFTQQSGSIEYVFEILCRVGATVLLIFFAIVLHYRKSNATNEDHDQSFVVSIRWLHTVLSVLTNWSIPQILKEPQVPKLNSHASIAATKHHHRTSSLWYLLYLPLFISVIISCIATWIARKLDDVESIYYHYGLCISSGVLLLSAFLLRNDHQQLRESIHDLQKSKYRYKAL
jgi:NADH:ubiquinone oxidoreductase subunit 5 (subunit L)/multisubunit Na+/H+ antiporter MnhA subunit